MARLYLAPGGLDAISASTKSEWSRLLTKEPAMKNLMRILVLLVAVIAVLSLGAAAQSRDRVCVYENNYYHGWEQCFAVGEQIPDLGDHRNKISSIRVFGNAMAVVYANKNFDASLMEVTSDVQDLAQVPLAGGGILQKSWNDIIESLQVRSRVEPRRVDNNQNNNQNNNQINNQNSRVDNRDRDDTRVYRDEVRLPRTGACFYEQPEYRGRYACFDTRDEVADLGRGLRHQVSSIRLFGAVHVTLFQEVNFRGERVTINRDVRDLRDLRRGGDNWNNRIASFDIDGGRGHAYGRDRDSRYDR
jgi:hypothetical protein